MTTTTGGNEVFRPTPIQFEKDYDVTKMRRLALDVNNLSNRLAALTVVTSGTGGTLPAGGTTGQVLTKAAGGVNIWANPQTPATFPYGQLTGVPTTFAPSQHLIASTTGLGPAHTIQAGGPSQVLKSTGFTQAIMAKLNYAELGDVDVSGLGGGMVPVWNGTTNTWQMQLQGALFGTLGQVLTGQGGGTPAIFLPIPTATFPTEGVAGAQWGLYPSMATPNQGFSGTLQNSQLNIPKAFDSILGGDAQWHPLADIEISWAQLSDVPPIPPSPTGTALRFLRDDFSWQAVPIPPIPALPLWATTIVTVQGRAGQFYIEPKQAIPSYYIGQPVLVFANGGTTEDQCTQMSCTAKVVSGPNGLAPRILVQWMSVNNAVMQGQRSVSYILSPSGPPTSTLRATFTVPTSVWGAT